mmetsp:Transcript_6390/g.12973  ORF Transcript_6390/g.12973 Transcript_6390/m.12973 type:complete len:258 (+) Transcript_6390:356-1129(+)
MDDVTPLARFRRVEAAVPRGLQHELVMQLVADTQVGGCECVRPHLQHPPEHTVGLLVPLQLDGQLRPGLRQLAQLLLVDDDGAVADGVDLASFVVEALRDGAELGVLGVDVKEGEGSGPGRGGPERHRAHEEVVGLRHEDVVLPDVALPQELDERVRPVQHHVPLVHAAGEWVDHNCWDFVHQIVRRAAVQNTGEPAHRAIRIGSLHLLVVVIHDARLPRHILGIVGRQQHMVLSLTLLTQKHPLVTTRSFLATSLA